MTAAICEISRSSSSWAFFSGSMPAASGMSSANFGPTHVDVPRVRIFLFSGMSTPAIRGMVRNS